MSAEDIDNAIKVGDARVRYGQADLDGFIKLNDAGIATEQAQADIAGKMADVALKWEAVQHAHLENVALFLKIKWDAEAHHNLIRMRTQALQRLRAADADAKTARQKIMFLRGLFSMAPSAEGVRQGWLGWAYVARVGSPATAIAYTMANQPTSGFFAPTAWDHPDGGGDIGTMPVEHSITKVMRWAAAKNFYPAFGGEAYAYLGGFLVAMDAAAGVEAARLDAEVVAARAAADEILKTDWSRLSR